MLWEIDVYPTPDQPDLLGHSASAAAAELGLGAGLRVSAARGYLIQADWDRAQAERVARELLVDSVVERAVVAPVGDDGLSRLVGWAERSESHHSEKGGKGEREQGSGKGVVDRNSPPLPFSPSPSLLLHVLPKPGVMDPVAQSVMSAIEDFGLKAEVVRTLKKYWIEGLPTNVGWDKGASATAGPPKGGIGGPALADPLAGAPASLSHPTDSIALESAGYWPTTPSSKSSSGR